MMTTISQIKVGKHQCGIVDLDAALKETAKAAKIYPIKILKKNIEARLWPSRQGFW